MYTYKMYTYKMSVGGSAGSQGSTFILPSPRKRDDEQATAV